MATVAGLNKTFNNEVLDAIGYKQEGENWVIKNLAGQSANKIAQREELKRQHTLISTQIDQLADQDNKARKDIMDLFKKEVPNADAIVEIKAQFENHHKELKKQLSNLHEQQYEQFELALENSPDLSLNERRDFLTRVKGAQQAQLAGLDKRAEYDQRRLDSLNLETMADHRDQKFSAYVLNLAEEKEEAVGKYYRPSIFSTLKQLRMSPEEREKYDVIGEVERERASGFSATEDPKLDSLKWDKDTQKWRAKKVWEEEQKKQAATIGVREGGEREWEGDWIPLEENADYLLNRKEIKLTNLPSAGIIKHLGPTKFLEKFTPLLDEPSLRIQFGQHVDENKKKGIPATDDAILCSFDHTTSPEQKAVMIQTIMHGARAKGWRSVEIGYDIPESLQQEAYLAARRVGYKDKDILVRGKPMLVDDELKAKGNSARALIEEAFPRQTAQPDSNVNAVIQKLTDTIPYDLNLNPTKFFTLAPEQQKLLFQKANLDQQAAIIADCAFNPKLLNNSQLEENYLNFVIPRQGITSTQKEILFKQLVDAVAIANKNPARALEIFKNKVPNPIKQGVFDRLEPETAAKLLMRLSLEEAKRFFDNIRKPNMLPDEAVKALNKQIKILEAPGLSHEMIYRLYLKIPTDLKEKALKNLATTPNGAGVVSAIVAQLFMSEKNSQMAVQRLLEVVENLPNPQKRDIVGKVYEALPQKDSSSQNKDSRISFLEALIAYEGKNPGSVQDIINMYEKKHIGNSSNVSNFINEKLSDKQITLAVNALVDNSQAENAARFLYSKSGVNSTEIADKLLRSAPGNNPDGLLRNQLFALVRYAGEGGEQDLVRLNGILNNLGPNVVGKTLAAWVGSDGNNDTYTTADKLVGLLYQRKNYELLANALQVCDNLGGRIPKLPKQLMSPKNPAEIQELATLLSHVKQPTLTRVFLNQKAHLTVHILQTITKPEEKAKIFQHLSDEDREKVYDEYLNNFTDANLKQQRAFFAYLPPNKQETYITAQLSEIMKANDPVRSSEAANQAIACLNNPHLTVERRAELRGALSNEKYKLIIDCASKPTAGFLKDYLVRTIDGGKLDAKFQDIVNLTKLKFHNVDATQQDSYLYIVGEAVALLEPNEQISLLVNGLHSIGNPQITVAVQASALVHLVNSNNQAGAKKLLAEIVKPTNGVMAPELTAKINDLRAGLSESVSNALQQLITPAPGPAAAPPQNQV